MLKTNLTIPKVVTILTALFIQSITLSHASNWAGSTIISSAGELELHSAGNKHQPALLLDTNISGDINGMIASISVEQTFKNQSAYWVNGRYAFPLPDGAAVDSLTIQIGERVIDGLVKEKEQAKKIFKQAKQDGKKAGLLEQHRPNLFSISIANIGPHEQVIAKITFIDQVKFQNDVFSLTLPTTLTPRYVPDAPISTQAMQQKLLNTLEEKENVDIDFNSGWSANTTRVVDASDITPPQTHTLADKTSHYFRLALSLNAGLDLQAVESDSHAISADFGNS